MKASTRDPLLRAGFVLALGLAAALGVMAFQRWESADALVDDLGSLEATLAPEAADAAGPDVLGPRVRDRVRDRYVFAPAPAERFRTVRGVLGSRVFFEGGESRTVGEEFDGAEVLAIDAESVDFRKDGREVTVRVGGGGGGGDRAGRRGGRGGGGRGRGGGRRPGGRDRS